MTAQWAVDGLERLAPGGRGARWLRRALMWYRRAILTAHDPVVRVTVAGRKLKAPLSHLLPLITRAYPQYNRNLGRLARAVADAYPDATMIDIGANIGDSVAFVRAETDIPMLCIEGDERFYRLLRENVQQVEAVETEEALVGEHSGEFRGALQSREGTGSLIEAQSAPARRLRRLAEILDAHPKFRTPKLLKTDTDGFDNRILRGAADVLGRAMPVIFFEYDPFFLRRQNEEPADIFPFLRSLGYRRAMIYENVGDYLLTLDLDEQDLLEDVTRFYENRGGERYCDLAAFHEQDEPLLRRIRLAEIEFFERYRSGQLPTTQR